MVGFGKWYVFKCFSPYIKPLVVSWSPFFILHRLRSFRTCSVGWHSFIVCSMSSFPTFLPGKFAISVLRCSKVRFGWPICFKTLFSQRSISIESEKEREVSTMNYNFIMAWKKSFQISTWIFLLFFMLFRIIQQCRIVGFFLDSGKTLKNLINFAKTNSPKLQTNLAASIYCYTLVSSIL